MGAFGAVSGAVVLLRRCSGGGGALPAEPHAITCLQHAADSLAGLCDAVKQVMQEQEQGQASGPAWAGVQAAACDVELAAWTACAEHVKLQLQALVQA